jgi:hypothetical protein
LNSVDVASAPKVRTSTMLASLIVGNLKQYEFGVIFDDLTFYQILMEINQQIRRNFELR